MAFLSCYPFAHVSVDAIFHADAVSNWSIVHDSYISPRIQLAQQDNTLTILCVSIRGGVQTGEGAGRDAATGMSAKISKRRIKIGSLRRGNHNVTKSNGHSNDNDNDNDNDNSTDVNSTPRFSRARAIVLRKAKSLQNSRARLDDDSSFTHIPTNATATNRTDGNGTAYYNNSSYISSLQQRTLKAKQVFLDRMNLVSSTLLNSERDAVVENTTSTSQIMIDGDDNIDDGKQDDVVTLQSDLLRPGRKIFVVTTAAIPWFTGTSVNPLLRAAYLNRMTRKINHEHNNMSANSSVIGENEDLNATSCDAPGRMVTLVIPWLELESDRLELYGPNHNFTSPEDQETYIRAWLRDEADMPQEADPTTGIRILFYPARYHSGLKSIFAMGDMSSLIDDADADVCILEEPEHLNWYRAPGDGWTKKFHYVIGIIHTNYVDYASSHYTGLWTAPAIRVMSKAMVRAYCHVVIKLSDTLQTFADEKERTSNVHGVRLDFLKEGQRRADEYYQTHGGCASDESGNEPQKEGFEKDDYGPKDNQVEESSVTSSTGADVYFIGKLLWAKGLDKMLDLEQHYKEWTGDYFAMDVYGNGPEELAIKRAFEGREGLSTRAKKHYPYDSDEVTSETQIDNINQNQTMEFRMYGEENSTGLFSSHMAKISKHIHATTENIKSTKESIETDFPRSFQEFRKDPIPSSFPGRVDHALLSEYKVFVNPSESEVLCTTTAEALAMGKFIIIPVHPSNTFFMQFDNCLSYSNKLEFVANLHWALHNEPSPLKSEQRRLLTWEAATERLVSASAITRGEAKAREELGRSKIDDRIVWFHKQLGAGARGDLFRKVLGAGPVSDQVAYELSKQQLSSEDEGSEDERENEQGLSIKFAGSSLAEAIRSTLINAGPGYSF